MTETGPQTGPGTEGAEDGDGAQQDVRSERQTELESQDVHPGAAAQHRVAKESSGKTKGGGSRRARFRGRARRSRVARLVVVLVVLGVVVAGSAQWLWPRPDDVPAHTPVLVQLGGVPESDYDATRALAASGVAPVVMLSIPDDQPDGPGRSGPTGTSLHSRVCAPMAGVEVICFAPDPSTTRGEARAIAAEAERRGWTEVTVFATGRPHVARARYVIGRCYPGHIVGTAHPRDSGPAHLAARSVYQSIYQSAGWAKALVIQEGC